jgi:hypothetical protein
MHVTVYESRIFLELAESGCGVGCKYCYIPNPAEQVQPLPTASVSAKLVAIERHPKFCPGHKGTLLAIGCDTELGLNPHLSQSVCLALGFALKHDIPVQLATKYPLSLPVLNYLARFDVASHKPVIFTSFTVVTDPRKLEPGAPSVQRRAQNFLVAPRVWLSYALIKPFLIATWRDRLNILNFLEQYRPDGVVVGVPYRPSRKNVERDGEHPFVGDWSGNRPSAEARQFVELVRNRGHKVFMNTECVVAFHNRTGHAQQVHDQRNYLCVGCGACRG